MTNSANYHQLELQRQHILKVLDAQKSQAERNRLGQFATPPQLAAEIVDASLLYLDKLDIRFLDPAFGTGPFYSALLRSDQIANRRLQAAHGFEIDPHYAVSATQLWANTPLVLHTEDFTRATPPGNDASKYNLLICNPPYVRHHHLSQAEKLRLQRMVEASTQFKLNGLSGLYCYFMLLATAWMSPAGLACWLVPAEFMDVNYGKTVRRYLATKVNLLRIHRFNAEASQFDDALVSSAVVWLRNEPPSPQEKVEFTFGGTVAQPQTTIHIDRHLLGEVDKWNAALCNANGRPATALHRPDRPQLRLGDLFHIKRGLATGDNNFFIMSVKQAEELGIAHNFLKPVLPSPRFLHTDIIGADADGFPKLPNPLALLNCSLPEAEIEAEHPQLWQYLQTGVQRNVHKTYLCSHRSPWYSQERREPAPLLCTYMGRVSSRRSSPFRFILNSSVAIAANTYLMLYPTSRLAALGEQLAEALPVIWQELNAVSAASLVDEGRAYGGGLHKLEPSELANLSLDWLLHKLPVLQAHEVEQLSLWE